MHYSSFNCENLFAPNRHVTVADECVATADEAVELPPVKFLTGDDIQELTINVAELPGKSRNQLFDKIGEQEFDDILCLSNKKVFIYFYFKIFFFNMCF